MADQADDDANASSSQGLDRVVVFVSSSRNHLQHRRAIRNSWLRFLHSPSDTAPETKYLSPEDRARVTVRFVVSRKGGDADAALDAALDAEQRQHNDLFFAQTPEGYDRLWAKALEFLRDQLEEDGGDSIAYFFHADDDSYVRLDLLLRDVLGFGGGDGAAASPPRPRFYWGYAWNTPQNPTAVTSPIRDPRNKSHMPEADYPLASYPPFCSGCGFALSRDLAAALVDGLASGTVQPQYRVLDPPFGIYLCGPPPPEGRGLFGRGDGGPGPVTPVHEPRVRPYRALPLFDASTIVQHYLRPEEMRPFHERVIDVLEGRGGGEGVKEKEKEGGAGPAAELYEKLVGMGLLRR